MRLEACSLKLRASGPKTREKTRQFYTVALSQDGFWDGRFGSKDRDNDRPTRRTRRVLQVPRLIVIGCPVVDSGDRWSALVMAVAFTRSDAILIRSAGVCLAAVRLPACGGFDPVVESLIARPGYWAELQDRRAAAEAFHFEHCIPPVTTLARRCRTTGPSPQSVAL